MSWLKTSRLEPWIYNHGCRIQDCRLLQETRPHFGNARLRIATVIRSSPGAPWGVQSRRTLLSPTPPWDPRRVAECCEAPNGEGAPTECRSCCVAGPMRDTSSSTAGEHRAFGGLYCMDLPQWRSRGFFLANTLIGCRQSVIGVRTDETGEGRPSVRCMSFFNA